MDEVSRTLGVYESDSDVYVEKYRAVSAADLHGDEFLDALERPQPGTNRLLDLGCGPGSDIDTFTDAGYEVVGLDITQSFLREATEHVLDTDFVRGDMRTLPFPEASFDGIWASASLHHVPRTEAEETLGQCRHVLRPGGQLYVSVKRDEQLDDDDTDRHFTYYTAEEFRSLLDGAGFDVAMFETAGKWVATIATH